MRYIRVCYMCPECNQMHFFNKESEFSTKCSSCNVEMVCVEEKYTSTEDDERYEKIQKSSIISSPTVTCPYCQSTNTKKITITSKAVHTAMFGVFSMGRNAKEWYCNSCKSEF